MKQLLKLLALNKSAQRKFEVVKGEADGQPTTIYLYDAIVATDEEAMWWGGVSAQSFVKELRTIEGDINLRINSPGGDVFAARAMEQALREHAGKVVAYIDGYAASAASYLALAADEVQIAAGGFFMIHKAWTFAYGNEHDLISTAGLLGKIDESLVGTYAAETGQDAQQLRDWMAAETWFNAEESVQYGFADSIAAGAVKDAAQWDLSAYSKAPGAKAKTSSTLTVRIDAEGFAEDIRTMVEKLVAESGIKPAQAPATTAPTNTDELQRRLRLAELTA